jgi:glycosyltransferase involved in cell wall biosynthesis
MEEFMAGTSPVRTDVPRWDLRGPDGETEMRQRLRIPQRRSNWTDDAGLRPPDDAASARIGVDGKFLRLEDQTVQVRGVTYGSFRPRDDGQSFPESARVEADFQAMARLGLNTVRTYTLPPPDVLDLADEAGLRLIVGLHYPDWRDAPSAGRRTNRGVLDAGRRAVAAAMERCAGRATVLAVSVGNEVPGDLVRLHGIGAVEETLSHLVAEVHAADVAMLTTYTSYPTTEYLQVAGQDLASFNVFLEHPDSLRRYLLHLQIVAGDRPVVITELGLAAQVHGADAQAVSLAWQLQLVEETGCAGATVFSWTDEWAVGGKAVEGWGFGITDAARHHKPAAAAVRTWTNRTTEQLRPAWPRVSVVVCAFNEQRLIGGCLASLERLDYPDYEVIVCDDGSTDDTLVIARAFAFRVLALPHGGLGAARNAGVAAADAEIVAFLDADAECHPRWLSHLVLSLEDDGVVATGGPNLPVPGAGFVERAVALSPGAPTHVLVAADRAEHVPGCNMAFRKQALQAVGGFDTAFTNAGDDVDVCWKLLDGGGKIAFAPTAQVRHHRRGSVPGYLRQQRGYGKAEVAVSRLHPHRFNRLGQARWRGFIYDHRRVLPALLRPIVYHGPMGLAPYQTVARRRAEPLLDLAEALLPLTVPCTLVGVALTSWSPWALVLPALAALSLVSYAAAVCLAVQPDRGEPRPGALRLLVAALHVLGPLARAWGRLRSARPTAPPGPGRESVHDGWTGDRVSWLHALERGLRARRCVVRVGRPHDHWDLRVSRGPLLDLRLTTAVAWNWLPRHRAELRPRQPLLVVLGAGVPLWWVMRPLGLGLLVLAGAGVMYEFASLSRRVRKVVTATTRHARADAGGT